VKIFIFLLSLLGSFYIQGMEEPNKDLYETNLEEDGYGIVEEQALPYVSKASLKDLPVEMLLVIVSQIVAQSSSLAEVMKAIYTLRMVNKDFNTVFDDSAINRIARNYMQQYPEKAEKEFKRLISILSVSTEYDYPPGTLAKLKLAKIYIDAGMVVKFIPFIQDLISAKHTLTDLISIEDYLSEQIILASLREKIGRGFDYRSTAMIFFKKKIQFLLGKIRVYIDASPEIIKITMENYIKADPEAAAEEFIAFIRLFKENLEPNSKYYDNKEIIKIIQLYIDAGMAEEKFIALIQEELMSFLDELVRIGMAKYVGEGIEILL